MSQLTIKLSAKADALIAQLQKEIFNRRRKKVSAAGVIETLVESGAKSQSDKRFATSWKNLIADIEKAAKVANAHGSKPANLTDAEWAMVLSHRSRTAPTKAPAKAAPRQPAATKAKSVAKPAAKNPVKKRAVKAASAKPAAKPAAAKKPAAKRTVAKKPSVPATGGSSVAKRMAKAMSRLASPAAAAAPSSNGTGVLAGVS
ncbi:MAG: hypothetical protein RLZZ206_2319 [Cyanobacteriota bacterium]|jgi:hypothetical protein